MVNSRTQVAEQMMQSLHRFLSKEGPHTLDEICTKQGLNYKTAYRYISVLQDRGMLRVAGFKDKKYMYEAGRPAIIPVIPTRSGPVGMMDAVKQIAFAPDDYVSPIEQNTERYNYFIAALMKQAISFNEDTKVAIEKYLRTYRDQLDLRIRVINVILKDDKFWSEDAIAQFKDDVSWSEDLVNKAWTKENEKANKIRREEFKAANAKDPMAD